MPTSVSGFAYQNTANQFTTLFGASTSGKIMELKSGDKSVILSAVGAVTVPAVATGNAVKYGGGLGNAVDLSLLSSYDGAELLITLNQPGVSGAAFELDLDGLTVEPTASGHVLLKDTASGAVWGRINRAFAIDANGEFTADVSYSISQQAGKFLWRIAASPAWLGDPERTYPVVIDPWMSLQGEGTGEHGLQDIMLNANYPDTNYEGWYLYVGPGAVDHPFRSLVQFDISSLGTNIDIINARFKLWMWSAPWAGSIDQTVYRLTRNWNADNATWNSYDNSASWTNAGGDFTTSGSATATAGSSGQWVTWEQYNGEQRIARMARYWYRWTDDYAANTGLLVKNDDEATANKRKYYLSNEMYSQSDRRPLLEVGYQENGCLWDYTPGNLLLLYYKWGSDIETYFPWKTYFEQSTSDWSSTDTPVYWSYNASGGVTLDSWYQVGGSPGDWAPDVDEYGIKIGGTGRLNRAALLNETADHRRAIAGHELGHAVNLTDIDWEADWNGIELYTSLMGYADDTWDTDYVPQPDDIDRVNSIYPYS